MYRKTSHVGTLIALAVLALVLTGCGKEAEDEGATQDRAAPGQVALEEPETPAEGAAGSETGEIRAEASAGLPRLVDLGRGTCVPCKMMAPILEELRAEYEGRAVVEVIDLREDSEAASEYGIRVIPTQIFFDSGGNEVWRHEGFLPKDQIIARFTEMGVPPLDD